MHKQGSSMWLGQLLSIIYCTQLKLWRQ